MADLKIKASTANELVRCVKQKLEQAAAASSNKALGQRLFVEHRLELAPFKAVPFSGWGDWEQDPLNNRSWQWRLNWLSCLSYLMAHHRAVGDDAVLDMGKAAIESWLDTYLDTDTRYPFEFIWHDHATALRAEQLVLFAYYCRAHAPAWVAAQGTFFEYLKRALQVHGEWLAKDSFYSEHTNHGLEQARVLLLLGTVFEGEVAREWQAVALRRLSSELNFSFTSEGVHVENSPAYHIFVFKVFMGIIKDYPAEVLGDLDEQFSQFSVKALGFVTHILRPDGLLPPIGDTEQLPTSDGYRETFGHTLGYQHFVYALTKGQKGLRPTAVNRVYPESGYAVFRDQWAAHPQYDKAFHLIVKVGCSSRYHHQQDEGHVSLFAGGEDWLIDSGLYNYIEADPVRKYMRSRAGHNVPVISHASYDKRFEHRLRAWQVTAYDQAEPRPFVEMKLEVMPPVVHKRRVDFDAKARVVAVQDAVSADDGQRRNITLQWHFPKDKTILIEGKAVVVSSATGNQLTISFEGEVPDQMAVVADRKDDRVFSCISHKANQVESSKLLRVVFSHRAGLRVTTRFAFELAAGQAATPPETPVRVAQPLGALLESWGVGEPVAHSVVLGGGAAGVALAQAHRAQALGHVSVLTHSVDACHELEILLEPQGLGAWLNARPVELANTPPITADKAALRGLEGIGVLLITGGGFAAKRLEHVLVTMLPVLLTRMSKAGELWVSEDLPEPLKALCEAWAGQHGRTVRFFGA